MFFFFGVLASISLASYLLMALHSLQVPTSAERIHSFEGKEGSRPPIKCLRRSLTTETDGLPPGPAGICPQVRLQKYTEPSISDDRMIVPSRPGRIS
jgi:hypothetical protein